MTLSIKNSLPTQPSNTHTANGSFDLSNVANDPLTILCALDPKGIGKLAMTSKAHSQRLNEASDRETSLLAFAKEVVPQKIQTSQLTDASTPYSENKLHTRCDVANSEYAFETKSPLKSFSEFSAAEKESYVANSSITQETNRKGIAYGQSSSWSQHHEKLLKSDTNSEYVSRTLSLAFESIDQAQQSTDRSQTYINLSKEQNAEFEIFLLAVSPHENASALKPRIAHYASLCTEEKFSLEAMNTKSSGDYSLSGNEKISIKAALAGSPTTPKNILEALSKNDNPTILAGLGKNTTVKKEWTNS